MLVVSSFVKCFFLFGLDWFEMIVNGVVERGGKVIPRLTPGAR